VRHGSTVATNALLERRGARVTLLTTRGFEDVLEIGRQDRPDLYALAPRRAEPLVPSARRIGVDERVTVGARAPRAFGRRRARAVRAARRTRPQAIAVGLLHAWAHDRHERRLERALTHWASRSRGRRRSARGARIRAHRHRGHERLSGAARGGLRAGPGRAPMRLEIVLSHGGTAPPERAAREPVRQLLSARREGCAQRATRHGPAVSTAR